MRTGSGPTNQSPPPDFQGFSASALYCPRCRKTQPVREIILLVLPDGQLYDYRCSACGQSLGTRKVTGPGEGFAGKAT